MQRVIDGTVPESLRRWFVAHFVVDVVFAAPLLLAPATVLRAFGWTTVDPVSARLVGAALFAIGTQSFLGRHDGPDAYQAMLRLKVLWSAAAIVGLLVSIGEGAPQAAWLFLAVFVAFAGVWNYYLLRLRQMAAAPDDEPDDEHPPS